MRIQPTVEGFGGGGGGGLGGVSNTFSCLVL